MSVKKIVLGNGEVKWEVRLYENGRGSSRITRRFDRKVEAEEFAQDFKKQRREKKNPFSSSEFQRISEITFQELASDWVESNRARFSASHLKRVEGVLKEILPDFGALLLHEVTPEKVVRLQNEQKAKGLANATVNRKTEVIVAALNYAVALRKLQYNPALGFKKFSASSEEIQFWSEEEAANFLDAMNLKYPSDSSQRWVFVVYLLVLNTALRAGEVWGLQVRDLNPDRVSLWIRRQYNRVTLDFSIPKGRKPRHVPANRLLVHELDLIASKSALRAESVFFRNCEGKPICHDNFADRTFANDLKDWGGRRIRFHDLRHTATTHMIAQGVDIKTVKEICGHAEISTTMRYVHLLSGSIARVAQSFSIAPARMNSVGGVRENN